MNELIDRCKKCGCTSYECFKCYGNKFYRHVDDKIKMKKNLKTIRINKAILLSRYILLSN